MEHAYGVVDDAFKLQRADRQQIFGNATIARKNNSPRFDKWMEVHLDLRSGRIIGG